MGVVLKRVKSDTSAPPSLFGVASLEAPIAGAPRWNDSVDVAVIGGGATGLWAAYHLAAKGSRVAVVIEQNLHYIKWRFESFTQPLGSLEQGVARACEG